ncbi:DUF3987 domain-containing protein [Halomonas sp. ATBC28]|uniref:YfjI family protein n=1 Tax=Halomonas sp. ATBC28 TaxID=2545264 RepID=UPI00110D68AF|nr:YfjI family protein [Halomonas sp. ATBC28]TMU14889.1 DUF3987 domain-containing protein [Halomonas sp. ATBC28]
MNISPDGFNMPPLNLPPAKEGELPPYIENSMFESATREVAQHVEVMPEMARTTALAAMAVACQGVVDVAFPNGNVVPTSLNLLTIAESGERKTALENWFFKPIRRFQAEKKAERVRAMRVYERKLKNWNDAEKALTKARTQALLKGDPVLHDIERKQAEQDEAKPQPPRNYQLIYENVTPSALAFGLYENIPLACLLSSEAGSVFEGKALQDLSLLNSIWSSTPLDVARRSSPSFTLDDSRLTLALMAQPKVIERFLEKRGEEARDNGFLSRFMVIMPTSLIGEREGSGRPVNPDIMDDFNQRAKDLLAESFDILDSDEQSRRLVEFTPTAKDCWKEMQLSIEREMVEHGLYYHARGHGSKLMDNVTRVAAILHTFEGYHGNINETVLKYAYNLCRGYSKHYLEYLAGEPEIVTLTNELVREIHRLVIKNNNASGQYRFNKSLFRQHGRGQTRSQKKLEAALDFLIQLGHLKKEDYTKNYLFSETILLKEPVLKNGIQYTVDELPLYEVPKPDPYEDGRPKISNPGFSGLMK